LRMAEFAVGDRDQALDLVQDAMMRLAGRYADRPAAQWPPLFHRILQNRIRDWRRRERLRRRLHAWGDGSPGGDPDEAQGDPMDRLPDPRDATPLEEIARAGAITALEHALRALPPQQQQAFLLRVWEGLGVAQTARALGCSQGSVKTHYARALRMLRSRLEAYRP